MGSSPSVLAVAPKAISTAKIAVNSSLIVVFIEACVFRFAFSKVREIVSRMG